MSNSSQKPAGFALNGHFMTAQKPESGLHLVATPIGNLGDITLRALATLAGADLVYCEDTRITLRLFSHYQITTPLKAYHDHNGAKVRPAIIDSLKQGACIALVSDAGTPLVSDPGFKLVKELRRLELPVHMVPGASAPVMAMALSGFPSDRFQFCGFLPPKSNGRKKAFQEVLDFAGLSIFFESPKRLLRCLKDMNDVMPTAQIAVSRELTKKFEENVRGTAGELLDLFSQRDSIKGEITLVIWPGMSQHYDAGDEEVVSALREAVQTQPAARAALEVARRFGLQKRQLYDAAVALKRAVP